MPAHEKEVVDVTAVIRGILDNYPAGSAVLREFLQNSDDCGAHSQDFILDTRTFPTEALVDPALACCQGPALFAINDGEFAEKDWKALKHIQNSSKTADETSTGKYGLGFRSCYHVTDNPHILSVDKLLILDPHNRVEQYSGGFSLKLDNNDRHQYRDHFATFKSVLNDNDQTYKGTAIRLPLRLEDQAKRSGIKSVPTSVEDVDIMFKDFIKRELREVMLFLKNITNINLYKVGSDGDGKPKLVARAWIEVPVTPLRSLNRSRVEESCTYELCIRVEDGDESMSRSWILTQFVENDQITQKVMAARCGDKLLHLMDSEKLFPHVALAYPIHDAIPTGHPIQGKLFTLLPLPIITGFPLHIHAIFALTSSRQSLRNLHDVAAGSREEFLVEWNRAIFLHFIPKAWAALLRHTASMIIPLSVSSYDLWPDVGRGDQVYWRGLDDEMLAYAAPERIWPVVTQGNSSTVAHYPLNDVLLAPTNAEPGLLRILADCDVLVSRPPVHVYALVQKSQAHDSRLMTPSTVVDVLKSNTVLLRGIPSASLRIVCDYISTANDISLFRDIPLILRADGTPTSINPGTSYILVSKTEAGIFDGVDSKVNLLALEQIGEGTKSLLLSNSRIHVLQTGDVVDFLAHRCNRFTSRIATISAGVGAEDVAWLVKFWNWLGNWPEAPGIWTTTALQNRFNNLHIIPLSADVGRHEIRLFSKASIDPLDMDGELLQAFRGLRLPILHASVTAFGSVLRRGLKPTSDVNFILSELHGQQSFSLSRQQSRRIHDHFAIHLPSLRQQLQHAELKALRRLPIYPTLRGGLRKTQSLALEAWPESSYLVDDSIEVVPMIPGKPIIAASECRSIVTAMYTPHQLDIKRESEVLELAIQAWKEQDQRLASLLIGRIINRLGDLSSDAVALITRLPIIDVGLGPSRLRSPADTVDPSSSIAELFEDEEGVFPQGLFASNSTGSYLRQLRNHGMLLSTLSASVVAERISYIVNPATQLRGKDAKAKTLLRLLDDFSNETHVLPVEVIRSITSQRWLPVGRTFYRPSDVWDHRSSDVYLCDRVLPLVDYVVSSPSLRRILGWQMLPFDILKQQYLAVLSELPTPDTNRIIHVIQAVSQRFEEQLCTTVDLGSLAQSLDGQPWVPVSDGRCLSAHRALLQNVDLGGRFCQVLHVLLDDQRVQECLRAMGVPDRPSCNALYEELEEISSELARPKIDVYRRRALISTSLKILREVFWQASSTSTVHLDRNRILVPTSMHCLHPINSTFFNDIGPDISDDESVSLAHPDISTSFAETMGLERLSDRTFAIEGGFLGDPQLGENFCGRIKGVLKDYQIESASNEWIANADDADATEVGFVVDDGDFKSPHAGIHRLKELCQNPALVIWNNKTFSEGDFKGLLSTGEGGKRESREKIGRFGLGALSFYHFTEVALVVSGDHAVFLDPSGAYLHGTVRGSKRTAWFKPLKHFQRNYPELLRPLDGLFGFSEGKPSYDGTLFRLSLRTPQQAKDSKLSDKPWGIMELNDLMRTKFYDQAKKSLFFSRILKISAHQRNPGKDNSDMWSVREANLERLNRDQVDRGRPESTEMHLEMTKAGSTRVQKWLIYFLQTDHNGIPEKFRPLIHDHRLPPPSIGLAMRLAPQDATIPPVHSRLFATLPLSIETKLPVHIHASWILARDRRAIRFDAKDADGERPLDTQYNLYLLEDLIPELYLRMLATLASQYPDDWGRCWPVKTHEYLQPMVTALYEQFVGTTHKVCRTIKGDIVTPAEAIFPISKSRDVETLFKALRLPQLVHPLPFDTSFVAWEGLQTDDASKVAEVLHAHSETVVQLFNEGSQSSSHSLSKKNLEGIIEYLAKAKQDLIGLPLLRLGNGDVTILEDVSRPWIFRDIACCSLVIGSTPTSISVLFGSESVVDPELSCETCEILIKSGGNVRNLDEDGLRRLLGQLPKPITPRTKLNFSKDVMAWLPKLLDFLAACQTLTLEDVSDLPLIPVRNGNTAISLTKSRESTVFTSSSLGDTSRINPAIHLGILVTDPIPGLPPPSPVDLARLMNAFRSLEKDLGTLNREVSPHDWKLVTQWIREGLAGFRRLNPGDRETLLALPIFEARKGGKSSTKASRPANEIHMLPAETQLELAVRYLPHSTCFADHSYDLSVVLEDFPEQVLSHNCLLQRLQLPPAISGDEEHYFKHVFEVIISHWRGGIFPDPLVPDMDRILRKPEDLYDHNIDLFVTAFGDRQSKFVHLNYRTDMPSLIQAGVRTKFDGPTLIECAIALDEDARGDEPDRVQVRATKFWNFFGNSSAIREIEFDAIANLRFIPANRHRHEVSDFTEFARPLQNPDIASLNELVLAEHTSVVWTQRACFDVTPPDFITRMKPEMGVPTVEEVIRHLEVLTSEVALKFPSNRSLLNDLIKTYEWLLDHIEEARQHLDGRSESLLWLNVDDPRDESPWVWKSGCELVFNSQFDESERAHYDDDAKRFLKPYKDLVLCARAYDERPPPLGEGFGTNPETTHYQQLLIGWGELRTSGWATDIQFEVGDEIIKAHRVVLVAAIEHFRNALTGGFQEGNAEASVTTAMEFPTKGITSAFAMRSVIDYAYSGSFIWPSCRNTEESEAALGDLLALLDLSNLWMINELKNQTQLAIVKLGLVRLRTYKEILERAEACNAHDLVHACHQKREDAEQRT
ncbi:hypothetical protein FRB94_010285 [Tulasnella sp. JGI-2019a]|nr:hypothetical protein FRB94_010285 [Tulasnella sp. JGI-2019a]KAG9012346.1 hypothetical protein FRB93_001768 [Tulasnella sp. JGI-2019a]